MRGYLLVPLLSGQELDKLARELREWYSTTRLWLIEQLSDPYPYGSAPLTEDEQLEQYLSLTPEAWQLVVGGLEEKYRGLVDRRKRVQADLNSYISRMERLRSRMQGVM